jgi:hypothetical protein
LAGRELTGCLVSGFSGLGGGVGGGGGRGFGLVSGCGGDGFRVSDGGGLGGGLSGLGGVLLDQVLVDDDGNHGGGGDGDEGADDAGEGGAGEQRDDHREAHEIDTAAHDAWSEEGVLDLGVDDVEDEDAGHLGPGVGSGDTGGEEDGDDASYDGDDVEEAHEDAEEKEVADVQKAEGGGAAEAEDEHERDLSNEPAAHADFGDDQGFGEAIAGVGGEEGEEVEVDELAFEHEVDAEDEGGEEIEDAGDPERSGGEEILRSGGEDAFTFLGEGVDAELVGEGQMLDAGDDAGDAGRQVGGEALDVVHDRREREDEEEGEDEGDGEDQGDDGDWARRRPLADAQAHDLLHQRHEDDGEEGADVDHLEDLAETPGESQAEREREDEEDVAAHGGDLMRAIVNSVGVVGL